jgi:hypothetical protein
VEAPAGQPYRDGSAHLVGDLPGRVIVALDHLTAKERAAVYDTAQAFARQEIDGTRLPDAEPLFILRAAPDVLILVRREPGMPVTLEDIVRPATWQNLAHAG